jgi:hypothetical protein
LAAYQSAAVARHQKDLAPIVARQGQQRLPLSIALVGTGTSLQPLLASAGMWRYAETIEEYFPMELVQGQVVQEFQGTLAKTLQTSTVEKFKSDLEALRKSVESKKAKPAAIEELVKATIKEHGWGHGGPTPLEDQYAINRGAGDLAPLKTAYTRDRQAADPKGKMFARALFFSQTADQWKKYSPKELGGSMMLDASERKTFLYWKTEDQAAAPQTFAHAEPQVEAAWRLEKARVLAREKAEALAKEARDSNGGYLPILVEASTKYKPIFEFMGVARWVKPGPSSRAMLSASYEPYTVPDDDIEYPPLWPNFVDPLLDSLRKPGDTTVISDRPKKTYYVVALVRRTAPSPQDFSKETVRNRDFLLRHLEAERQVEYRRAFLEQLRAQARLSINEEAMQRSKDRTLPVEE